jgi:hypothetical protein
MASKGFGAISVIDGMIMETPIADCCIISSEENKASRNMTKPRERTLRDC